MTESEKKEKEDEIRSILKNRVETLKSRVEELKNEIEQTDKRDKLPLSLKFRFYADHRESKFIKIQEIEYLNSQLKYLEKQTTNIEYLLQTEDLFALTYTVDKSSKQVTYSLGEIKALFGDEQEQRSSARDSNPRARSTYNSVDLDPLNLEGDPDVWDIVKFDPKKLSFTSLDQKPENRPKLDEVYNKMNRALYVLVGGEQIEIDDFDVMDDFPKLKETGIDLRSDNDNREIDKRPSLLTLLSGLSGDLEFLHVPEGLDKQLGFSQPLNSNYTPPLTPGNSNGSQQPSLGAASNSLGAATSSLGFSDKDNGKKSGNISPGRGVSRK